MSVGISLDSISDAVTDRLLAASTGCSNFTRQTLTVHCVCTPYRTPTAWLPLERAPSLLLKFIVLVCFRVKMTPKTPDKVVGRILQLSSQKRSAFVIRKNLLSEEIGVSVNTINRLIRKHSLVA